MGQKINPVSLRLQYTNRHFDNCWYSNYFYKNLITRDVFLQHYLNTFLKGLKLPAGRYSIQHLQKKTQVFSFLCCSKSTREWRSKLLGFSEKKSFLKKNRFFFKNKTNRKWRTFSKPQSRPQTKLTRLFTTPNQFRVYQIQKRITSFQNLKLWSRVSTPTQRLSPFSILKTTSLPNFSLFDCKQLENTRRLEKSHQPVPPKQPLYPQWITQKGGPHSNLFFLQNLFVYKTLKSTLKRQNRRQADAHGNKNVTLSALGSSPKPTNLRRDLSYPLSCRERQPLSPSLHVMGMRESTPGNLDFKYKNYLESSLSSFSNLQVDFMAFKVKNDWQYASYLADELAYFLEKRIPFRRLKSKLLKEFSKIPLIRGVRILCSGRVGGKSKKAQRAKKECLKYGQTSLQVFSSRIDFSVKTAFTSFGSVGVKVWVCYR